MYLRGEGVDKNLTAAVEMYQLAAAQDNVRALNGAHLWRARFPPASYVTVVCS